MNDEWMMNEPIKSVISKAKTNVLPLISGLFIFCDFYHGGYTGGDTS